MTGAIHSNRLRDIQNFGQSVWLDELHRGMLSHSQFKKWVAEDGVSGVTSNPTIFARAFAEDAAYAEPIARLHADGADGRDVYERLSIDDVRTAADQLRKVYAQSERRDGYVSIEVAPRLAHDVAGTVAEGQRLFHQVDRPNVMIKVPSTDAGVAALRELIGLGINVNATLVFGTRRYKQVAEAYLLGLEDRVAAGRPLAGIASVVSLFVSRIDTLVDRSLDAVQNSKAARAQKLRGRTAVAVARLAYQEFKGFVAAPRWRSLAARHAQPQRLLWASTGTKDPRYSDVKYIEELIGPDTVSTIPTKTLDAFRDHGKAAPVIETGLLETASLPGELQVLGIDLEQVAVQLEQAGITAFAASMDAAIAQLEKSAASV